ncbi:MAG: sortase [Clostridia bacterium]|nr:sortase [Clostridia bacterium]
MNQILVTEKLYVTPELRRKKKIYKINFFLSVFLICLLFSYYIYAEYDKNRSEEISQEILSRLDLGGNFDEIEDNTTARVENNVLIVTIDETGSNNEEIDITKLAKDIETYIQNVENNAGQEAETIPQETYKTNSGAEYVTDAVLKIPSLDINYPVLKTADEHIDEVLKISLVKYWGRNPNEEGNYVVVGHNYKNKKMFGKLPDIQMGAIIELTDLTGTTLKYEVYDKYIVDPNDTSCTSQKTGGKKEITLITCRTYGTQRQVVKAREIK